MKVLTIKEPFASLIMNKIKTIELRSWKTNYRGEIYIHAGASKDFKRLKDRKELLKLIDGMEMNFGNIIAKCNLVDCVYITEDYIENLKKENNLNYICGNFEVGKYAWILDNIQVLDRKIPAKGQLGIWNYKCKL